MEEGALYSGWLTQPPPATLQPLTQWTTSPDYVSHEVVSCPYTADMFVQPVCPSYTFVGTSSVLTYTSQPLITNFAVSLIWDPLCDRRLFSFYCGVGGRVEIFRSLLDVSLLVEYHGRGLPTTQDLP